MALLNFLQFFRDLVRPPPAEPQLSREEAVAAARELVQQAEQSGHTGLLYRAIKLDPDNIEARRLIARSLMVSDAKTDQSEAQAIPMLNELIARVPSNPEFLFMRGIAHSADFGNDSAQKALDDFAAVIRLDPTFDYGWPYASAGRAFVERANIFRDRLKDRGLAVRELDQAVRHCPENHWAYYYRARMRHERGDLQGALADRSEVIALKADEFSYTARGEVYLEIGDFDRAIADFTAAIKINPWHGAYIGRGRAYEGKGDLHAALADYKRGGGRDGSVGEAVEGADRVRDKMAKRRRR